MRVIGVKAKLRGIFQWFPLKNTLYLVLCFVMAFPMDLMIPYAEAQSYSAGYQSYVKGRFSQSEQALKLALQKKVSKGERAKIYKLLGIVQYMRGDQSAANVSFQYALRYNPNLTIQDSEVLDTKVVSYFNSLKAKVQKSPPKRAVQSPRRQSGRGSAKAKRTTVYIQANVKASVSVDGILAGNTGSPIEVSPGPTVMTLKASGYQTKKIKVTVRPQRTNLVKIDLAPIAQKKRVVRKKTTRPSAPAPTKASSAEKDLFADEEPDYAKNRRQIRKQQKSLVDEFESDGRAQPRPYTPPRTYTPPAYSAPAPAYPSYPPPAYPAPTYPSYTPYPPVAPYYPPTYAPPVQPYAAPAPPAPSYSAPPAQVPDYFSSSPRSKKRKRGGRKVRKGSVLVALLPFGIGQFQNDDMIFGAFFAVAEAGALITYFVLEQEIASAESDLNAYIASEEASDQDKQQYLNEQNAFINDNRQFQDFALIGFVGLAIGGAIEAYVNMPMVSVRKRRRRYSLLPPAHLIAVKEDLSPSWSRPYEPKWEIKPYLFDKRALGLSLGIQF